MNEIKKEPIIAIHTRISQTRLITLHETIVRLRKQSGKTQQEVADKLNRSVSAYSRMERGESQLQVADLIILSEIFEVPLVAFFETLKYPHAITTLHPERSSIEAWTIEKIAAKLEEQTQLLQELRDVIKISQQSSK